MAEETKVPDLMAALNESLERAKIDCAIRERIAKLTDAQIAAFAEAAFRTWWNQDSVISPARAALVALLAPTTEDRDAG